MYATGQEVLQHEELQEEFHEGEEQALQWAREEQALQQVQVVHGEQGPVEVEEAHAEVGEARVPEVGEHVEAWGERHLELVVGVLEKEAEVRGEHQEHVVAGEEELHVERGVQGIREPQEHADEAYQEAHEES